jgi:predicted NBD/HSP70 family sugar kinase
MGLTRAATSLIADELLRQGVVEETMAMETHVGRTPTPLRLRQDAGYAVGVYLNRDGCTAGIVGMDGQVHSSIRLHVDGNADADKVRRLAEALEEMICGSAIDREKLVGIGVSAPGPLDGESGRILNPPRFDLWHNTDIGPVLAKRLGLPVYLENNASCLARYNLGKPEAMGSENYLLLLVDSGIGSGVISGGKVLKGAGYFTSELGHTSIDYRGKLCACGNIGCLEAYAAIPNLLRGSAFSSWRSVIDALPDPAAQTLVQQEAEYLAAGVVNLINMISIDTVLLAGDILYGAEKLAPILEEKINHRNLGRSILPVRVLSACSSRDSRIMAAADVAFGRFLSV